MIVLGPRNVTDLNKTPAKAPPLAHEALTLAMTTPSQWFSPPSTSWASGMSLFPGLWSTLPSASKFSQTSTSSASRILSHQDRNSSSLAIPHEAMTHQTLGSWSLTLLKPPLTTPHLGVNCNLLLDPCGLTVGCAIISDFLCFHTLSSLSWTSVDV